MPRATRKPKPSNKPGPKRGTRAAKPKAKPRPVAKPKAKPRAAKPKAKPRPAAKSKDLPEALRQALAIAANEVLIESLEMIAEDPVDYLDSGSLGATYQSFIGADTFPAAQVQTWLAELAPWAPATGEPWQRLGAALELASQDVTRAVVHQATKTGATPALLTVHAPAFTKVSAALKHAIEEGFFDEEDLEDLVAG